jgi:hypothetical protein
MAGMSSADTPAEDYLVGTGIDVPCELAVVGTAQQPPDAYHMHCMAHHCEQEDAYPGTVRRSAPLCVKP